METLWQRNRRAGLIAATAVPLFCASTLTAQSATDNSISPVTSTISYGYFDTAYLSAEGVQHLGVDLSAPAGADVLAPVAGTVVSNKTSHPDVMQSYLVIRDNVTGAEHVLGHITSDKPEGAAVQRGEPLGKVREWPGNSHVHWGVNSGQITRAMGGGWGWGRAPKSATQNDARSRGWLDANSQFNASAQATAASSQTSPTYDTSFTVKNKSILLPEKSKLLPETQCSASTKTRLEPIVGRISKCIGQVIHNGVVIAAYQNLNRTPEKPGAAWLFALGNKVTDLGNMSIKDRVQGAVWSNTNVEFLATNLDAVSSSSPTNPPYARYRVVGTGENLSLQLISEGPRIAGQSMLERDRAAVVERTQSLATSQRPATGSSQQIGGAWTQVPSKPPQPMAAPRVSSSGIAAETNQQVACRVAQWDGVAQNLADLFECDSGRAIENLSAGRRFIFTVSRVRFANGKVASTAFLQPTAVKLRSESMSGPSKGDNYMLNLIGQVNSRLYTISCQFPVSRASSLKDGKSLEVFGRLVNYSNDSISMECS